MVATGAHERPLVFAGNDKPGIMLAASARTYLHRFGVLAGREVVVFTTDDSAYAAAVDLADAGATVRAVVDARPEAPARWAGECADRGIEVRTGHVVTGTSGTDRVTRAHVARYVGGVLGERDGIACDLLLVCGGWNPAVHLFSQARGKLRYDAGLGAFVPGTAIPAASVAGAGNGGVHPEGALRRRCERRPQRRWAGSVSRSTPSPSVPAVVDDPAGCATMVLWSVPEPDPVRRCTRFVDLQRDATVADILRATGAGLRSVEHVKRYTTIGTAHDQGKTSGVIASGIVAEALGADVADLGTTTFRPPYTPVGFAALAGRDRGVLHDPVRVTAIHDWHVRTAPSSRTSVSGSGPGTTHRARRTSTQAVRRECAGPHVGRHHGRLHPRQDRRPWSRRRRAPRPPLHEPDSTSRWARSATA